jgi:hypothetical protein
MLCAERLLSYSERTLEHLLRTFVVTLQVKEAAKGVQRGSNVRVLCPQSLLAYGQRALKQRLGS